MVKKGGFPWVFVHLYRRIFYTKVACYAEAPSGLSVPPHHLHYHCHHFRPCGGYHEWGVDSGSGVR